MDYFAVFSGLIFSILTVFTVYVLLRKAYPKLKTRDAKPYFTQINAINDNSHYNVDDEDVEKIKRKNNVVIIRSFATSIVIVGIVGYIQIAKNGEVPVRRLVQFLDLFYLGEFVL